MVECRLSKLQYRDRTPLKVPPKLPHPPPPMHPPPPPLQLSLSESEPGDSPELPELPQLPPGSGTPPSEPCWVRIPVPRSAEGGTGGKRRRRSRRRSVVRALTLEEACWRSCSGRPGVCTSPLRAQPQRRSSPACSSSGRPLPAVCVCANGRRASPPHQLPPPPLSDIIRRRAGGVSVPLARPAQAGSMSTRMRVQVHASDIQILAACFSSFTSHPD